MGEKGRLEALRFKPLGARFEFLFGPIFIGEGAGGVDGDPFFEAAVEEAGRGFESIFGRGGDFEEDFEGGSDVVDHGSVWIADIVEAGS